MEDAPDPDRLAVGADASVLIDLVNGKRLQNLKELFGEVAVPALVLMEIERGLRAHPVNEAILRADYLRRVAADDPDDLQLMADFHRLWRSEPPDNAGEAELVVLSRRHSWIALLEDREGREAARREGVYPVRMTTCAVAAAACGVMTVDRAWGLHHGYHGRRTRPLTIGTTPADRNPFERAVDIVRRLNDQLGTPRWPGILNHATLAPGALDDLVAASAKRS